MERLKKLLAELKAKSEAMLSFRTYNCNPENAETLSQLDDWTDITHGLGYYYFL